MNEGLNEGLNEFSIAVTSVTRAVFSGCFTNGQMLGGSLCTRLPAISVQYQQIIETCGRYYFSIIKSCHCIFLVFISHQLCVFVNCFSSVISKLRRLVSICSRLVFVSTTQGTAIIRWRCGRYKFCYSSQLSLIR